MYTTQQARCIRIKSRRHMEPTSILFPKVSCLNLILILTQTFNMSSWRYKSHVSLNIKSFYLWHKTQQRIWSVHSLIRVFAVLCIIWMHCDLIWPQTVRWLDLAVLRLIEISPGCSSRSAKFRSSSSYVLSTNFSRNLRTCNKSCLFQELRFRHQYALNRISRPDGAVMGQTVKT